MKKANIVHTRTTFKPRRYSEANNIFWIDVCVQVHIPNNIMTWILQIVNTVVIDFITRMPLLRFGMQGFHVS